MWCLCATNSWTYGWKKCASHRFLSQPLPPFEIYWLDGSAGVTQEEGQPRFLFFFAHRHGIMLSLERFKPPINRPNLKPHVTHAINSPSVVTNNTMRAKSRVSLFGRDVNPWTQNFYLTAQPTDQRRIRLPCSENRFFGGGGGLL